MNYEDLLKDVQEQHKKLSEKADIQKRTLKKLSQSLESGDLSDLPKVYAAYREALHESENLLQAIETLTEAFDGKAYINSGEYAEQLLKVCRELGIDVHGEFPVYEMFPYRVVLNPESTEITVDRKKVSCLRPLRLARNIRTGLDKLSRDTFNASLFAKELANAYDLALLKQSGGSPYARDAECYLQDLYEYLAPMRRFRRDFDRQSYAYALARLYTSDQTTLDDGRQFHFGPSRNNRKFIRILDKNGKEQYISTISFYSV